MIENIVKIFKPDKHLDPKDLMIKQVILFCSGLATCIFPIVIWNLIHVGVSTQIIVSILVVCTLMGLPILLNKPKLAKKILYVLPVIGLVTVPMVATHTGGIFSVDLLWLALVPIAATLFVNSKFGLIVTGIAIFEIFIIRIATVSRVIPSSYLGAIPKETYLTIVLSIVLVFLWVISTYFERLKNKAITELANSSEAKSELSRTKSNFLANMSHEVRTPLHVILGTIELFRDTQLNQEQKNLINNLNSSSTTLYSILNDILDYEEISKGKISFCHQPFHLKHLIEDVKQSVKNLSEDKKIPIVGYFEGYQRYVSDPVRLKQIIFNLMSNAFKFTNPGGNVIVRVYGLEDGFEILIQDTGIGMNDDKLDQIFETFGQEENGPMRKKDGTGLGLNISQKITQMMGGTIEIHSKPNKGTTIKLYFKGKPITKEEFNSHKIDKIKIKDKIKILVVEDNKLNRELMEAFLREYSQIDLAKNGKEAISLIHENTYDIIFMDFHMPILDGFSTTAEIRKLHPQGKPPFIIGLTANIIEHDKKKAIEIGMDDYLSKPVNRDRVQAKITYWAKRLDENMS